MRAIREIFNFTILLLPLLVASAESLELQQSFYCDRDTMALKYLRRLVCVKKEEYLDNLKKLVLSCKKFISITEETILDEKVFKFDPKFNGQKIFLNCSQMIQILETIENSELINDSFLREISIKFINLENKFKNFNMNSDAVMEFSRYFKIIDEKCKNISFVLETARVNFILCYSEDRKEVYFENLNKIIFNLLLDELRFFVNIEYSNNELLDIETVAMTLVGYITKNFSETSVTEKGETFLIKANDLNK